MSDNSRISWTEATWNPITGCTRISEGCDRCYIERTPPFRMAGRRFDKPGVGGTTGVVLHRERLLQPLRWRRRRLIFVNSLADLFHEQVPDSFVAEVFAVMAAAQQHTFQVLTKRHARMRALVGSGEFLPNVGYHYRCLPSDIPSVRGFAWPLPNVWLLVSAENQKWADVRIPALLDTPAAVRGVSLEPLLGSVNLDRYLTGSDAHAPWNYTEFGTECMCGAAIGPGDKCTAPGLDWVITGGESGPGFRPANPDWSRSIRDQCVSAGVAYFHKQNGGRTPTAGGRELDGRTWDQHPDETE